MDHQQRFVVRVGGSGRPVEGSCDHGLVIDHRELVVELVTAGEAWAADALYLQLF